VNLCRLVIRVRFLNHERHSPTVSAAVFSPGLAYHLIAPHICFPLWQGLSLRIRLKLVRAHNVHQTFVALIDSHTSLALQPRASDNEFRIEFVVNLH
jgi:hypothetical protein